MNRIKEIRIKKEISQRNLAKRLGTTQQALSLYERGEREPKLETWQKLADYFGVSVPFLQGIQEYSLPNKFQPDLISETHFNYKISKNVSEKYVDQINKVVDKVYLLGKQSIAGNKEAQKIIDEINKIVSNHNIDLPLAGSVDMNNVRRLGSKMNSKPLSLANTISFKPLGLTFGKDIKIDKDINTVIEKRKN